MERSQKDIFEDHIDQINRKYCNIILEKINALDDGYRHFRNSSSNTEFIFLNEDMITFRIERTFIVNVGAGLGSGFNQEILTGTYWITAKHSNYNIQHYILGLYYHKTLKEEERIMKIDGKIIYLNGVRYNWAYQRKP